MTTISIHQPLYLGGHSALYNKILNSDKFILLDNVQISRSDFVHRNRIMLGKEVMLTHPLGKHKVQPLIKDIRIDKETSLKHMETITQAYKDTPYFDDYSNLLDYFKIIDNLSELNRYVIMHVCAFLDIPTEIAMCSPTDAQERLLGSDRILAICRKENATTYLSGPHGSYLNLNDFKKANIEVKFQDFKSNNLSVIDSLFRIGAKETRNRIKND